MTPGSHAQSIGWVGSYPQGKLLFLRCMVPNFLEPYQFDPEPDPAHCPVDAANSQSCLVFCFDAHFCYPWRTENSFSCFSFPGSLWASPPYKLPQVNGQFELPFWRILWRAYCSVVAVQCWSLRVLLFPLTQKLCVWAIALVTYCSLALWGKAFIVPPVFVNSCAYLWWCCK